MMLKASIIKIYSVCVFVVIVIPVLCSCTNIEQEKMVYVQGIGIEKIENMPVKLYVLTKEEKEEKSDSGSSGSDSKNNQDNGDAGQSSESSGAIIVFEGDSIEKAFDMLFKQQKNLYTGTNKIYAVATDDKDFLYEFKVYLTNSSKLPVKVKTVWVENAHSFLEQNAELKKQ